MGRTYRESMRVLLVLLVVIGLAMVTLTLVAGGGPLSLGVLLGTLLALLGAGRLVLAGGGPPRRDR